MPAVWPRNIVPYDEPKLRALGSVERVTLLTAAVDAPLVEQELSKSAQSIAHDLVQAGLLERRDGLLVATHRHNRDPDAAGDVDGQLEHKRAKLDLAQSVVVDARSVLEARGARAHAAIGLVTLPDTPEAIAQANAILAEAEDQLRALAEETAPDHGAKVRVLFFVGSMPS